MCDMHLGALEPFLQLVPTACVCGGLAVANVCVGGVISIFEWLIHSWVPGLCRGVLAS